MNITQAELDALLARRGKPQAAPAMPPPAPRSKYGAKRTEYAGRWYDSKAEAEYAMRLDLRVRAGELYSWEPQQTVVVYLRKCGPGLAWAPRLRVRGKLKPLPTKPLLQCRLDFVVVSRDGAFEYHEVKGKRTEAWVLRERILRLAGVPLVVIR